MAARGVSPTIMAVPVATSPRAAISSPFPESSGGLGVFSAVLTGLVVGYAAIATGSMPTAQKALGGYSSGYVGLARRDRADAAAQVADVRTYGQAEQLQSMPLATRLRALQSVLQLNASQTASLLNVSRPTLYAWLDDQQNAEPRYSADQARLREIESVCGLLEAAQIGRVNTLLHRVSVDGKSLLQRLQEGENVLAQMDRYIEALRSSAPPTMRRMKARAIDEMDFI